MAGREKDSGNQRNTAEKRPKSEKQRSRSEGEESKKEMKREQLTTLRWFDILIVTIIMFGEGIYNSTMQYLALADQTTTLEENVSFSTMQNYQALAMQSLWLFLAVMYLLFRNVDFSIFREKIRLTPWLPLQVIGLFAVSALAMDLYYLASLSLAVPVTPSMEQLLAVPDLSLLLYSLLNGFYEEIFFLGICLAVKPQYTKWAFLYSLVIRCSFHTYQGLGNGIALGILLGCIFYVLYRKMKPANLLPFFLAHAIADMVGLSIIFYFWR